MEKYNKMIAPNDKIEMIQVSLDQNRKAAESWAVADKLPWYTVLPEDQESFREYKKTGFVPEYALYKADGERLGTDEEVFPMIEKMFPK